MVTNRLHASHGWKLQVVLAALFLLVAAPGLRADQQRPNVLFCVADDWGWPHAGAYGDAVVQTPTFDRLAREGVLFEHAFVDSPSCTPSRNAMLTGQHCWRLEHGANLWSSLHPKFPVFPDLLAGAGYYVGHKPKAWGPGNWTFLGRTTNPAGPSFKSFQEFLAHRPADQPFCFWLGTTDPHRPYLWQSGAESGIDVAAIRLPADLPDHPIVRNDVADYYFEVQRFDREVGAALDLIAAAGELDNTIVVMTGDHGMPFPRHKTQLYDSGTRVCLAVRWGREVTAGRRVTDFVSLTDLAPTLLEAAHVEVPEAMTGQSLLEVLTSEKTGRVDPRRDHIVTARERHTPAQRPQSEGGYPMRALRTDDFLYIRNFTPDRWPAGRPNEYRDCDDGPTKMLLVESCDDPALNPYFELAFAPRPAEELYDLTRDPDQLANVAGNEKYRKRKDQLAAQLTDYLRRTADPRVVGDGERFDQYEYRLGQSR